MSSRGHGKGERRYRGGAGRRRLCKRVSDGGSRESPRMCVARRASLSYTTHRAARAATTVERRVGAAGDGQGGGGTRGAGVCAVLRAWRCLGMTSECKGPASPCALRNQCAWLFSACMCVCVSTFGAPGASAAALARTGARETRAPARGGPVRVVAPHLEPAWRARRRVRAAVILCGAPARRV